MPSENEMVFVRGAQTIDASTIDRHIELSIEESLEYRGRIISQKFSTESKSWVAGWGTSIFGSLIAGVTAPGQWHISHVFVEREAREMGIGDALVQHALASITKQNATWIGASAQPGDRSMKNLFERHGLIAQTITVGKSLSDPSK